MIRIVRTPAPEFLQSEKVIAAREKLQRSFNNAERQERFRFEVSLLGQVKQDLMRMCKNKCAYCESKLGVVSLGDVENFRPKSGARGFSKEEYAPMHYWWLAYDWDNLFISCQICNQKYKRDYFPVEVEAARAKIGATGKELLAEKALLVDPCVDDPAQHLEFDADGGVRELTHRGKVTIELLGLNRTELVERRREGAGQLRDRLEALNDNHNPGGSIGKKLRAEITELFSDHPSQEYAATQRTVFEEWYEQNASLWESMKKTGKDTVPMQHAVKKTMSSSEARKINKVDKQLSALKRFSIKTIEIVNFKSIENVTLTLLPVDVKESRESWLLMLGDNGIGKSSILQAIALALAGRKQLDKLGLDVTDYLKRGTDAGYIRIQSCEHDKPVELHFNKDGFRTKLDEAPTFIMGYGSTRLLPKGSIAPDNEKEPYINIRNLFDYTVALSDPSEWLCNIDDAEFKERVAPVFFDVLALRGKDRLFIEDNKIKIEQYGDENELEDNSDGYKTIVALVADIMQTLSIDKANYHNSQGIVLIDEIGNHLHPRWRMKIAAALRKAFPKLQFIVTTHEPLCLRGLSHGEVDVLVRDQKNVIRVLDGSLLPDHNMMTIEQLLTSDLFGLINVMDEETEKTYEEYYKLLSKKEEDRTTADRTKINEMSSELSSKEVLGRSTEEQVFYKVIDETFAKKIREEGFKTKEELKTETIDEVKNIIVNKKIGWL